MEFLRGVRYAALALTFLSLVSVLPVTAQTSSFTQTCLMTGTVTTPEACIVSTFPYMGIGILLSFLIIAVVYMIGNVMNFKPMKDWYKSELWEAIKTIMMVVIIISALVTLSAITDILVGVSYVQPFSGTANPLSTNLANLYGADNIYINQQLNLSYQSFAAMLGLSMGVSFLKNVSLSLWIGIPIFPPYIIGAVQFGSIENLLVSNFISAATGENSYAITQTVTSNVVVPMLMLFQFQSSYFYYIVTLGLGILIPLGIIFRAFPLVRNIGGTMIAIGIGVALVYPALILLLNMPVSNYIYAFSYSQTQSSNCPFSSGLICKAWNAAMASIAAANPNSAAQQLTNPVLGGEVLEKLPLTLALGTVAANNANVVGAMTEGIGVGLASPLFYGIYPTLNFVIDNMLGMILQFILVAIDLLLGLLITGAVTQVLGGKVRLGFGKKLSLTGGG